MSQLGQAELRQSQARTAHTQPQMNRVDRLTARSPFTEAARAFALFSHANAYFSSLFEVVTSCAWPHLREKLAVVTCPHSAHAIPMNFRPNKAQDRDAKNSCIINVPCRRADAFHENVVPELGASQPAPWQHTFTPGLMTGARLPAPLSMTKHDTA